MSVEPGPCPQSEFASLHSCFVEGGAEQRAREKCLRRRALLISVAVQTLILTAVILLPLFAKPERIALASMVPIPPYSVSRAPERPHTSTQALQNKNRNLCATCYSPNFPEHPPTMDNPAPQPTTPDLGPGDGRQSTLNGWGIPLDDGRSQPERPVDPGLQTPRRIKVTTLEPAMLLQRIEPVYPVLARQIRREGRVELRAIIATDGTIQSLQVVSGDALFIQSALDAVRQWRYRPTVLNGQSVEIDTFVTVLYSLHQ